MGARMNGWQPSFLRGIKLLRNVSMLLDMV
jgi:hypothetical protein